MKRYFSKLAVILMLSLSLGQTLNAQSGSWSDADKTKIDIMVGIRQLLMQVTKGFETIRGNKLSKQEDGSLVYKVKNFDNMHTQNQFILVKQTSPLSFYFASYGDDSKTLAISFQAFKEMKDPMTVEKDKELSIDGKEVYSMHFMGMKVAVYTMDTKKGEGVLLIGAL